jgi:glycosyltransferase involved in cell wall biosynthesis
MHDYAGARMLMPRLLRMYAPRCALVVANSDSVAADARAALGDRVKTVAIHNAVDLERFAPEGPVAPLDRLAGMPSASSATIKVGLVATMARWKGHALFLKALSMLPRDLPVRGYIVGGPIYQSRGSQCSIDELRAIAARLGIDGRVAFTGFVDDSAAAMRSLDIVIHASTEPEPFGLVIAEAMACGRPVITSCSGGAAELVADGVDAVVFRSGDAADLARKITILALDRAARERIAQAGRLAAERKFPLSRLARQMCSAYAEATGCEKVPLEAR